jgi:membrane-bound serine protease (ClpP class)
MKITACFIALLFLFLGKVDVPYFKATHQCFAATIPEIRVLTIEGVINPLSARYLKRELTQASQEKVQAVILELNTPGGLESSMREMTQSMLNSTLPIIVYVTPRGARAASAGMFITIAANIAAMAPGTNIGAAHPVGVGGGSGDQNSNETMKEKITSDAAAFARSIAKERGRNVTWVEQAVRKSVSIAAHEALKAKVIDLITTDLNDLLAQLNGRIIRLSTGVVTLQTNNVPLVKIPMHLPEKILQAITDPNLAYLLITIGFIGIMAELYSPGLYFPGITGTISLLLGFAAMGSFPMGWAGLVLLIFGIGLFFLETQEPGLGFFGVAGLIAFVLGSLMLYTPIGPVSPSLPQVRVSPWIIGGVTSGFIAFIMLVLKAVVSARRLPIATGRSILVGKSATAMTDLSPKGVVKLNNERWSAIVQPGTESEIIRAGDPVEVVDLEGAILKVKKTSQGHRIELVKSKSMRNQ